jgi:hypothetical protein
LATRIPYFPAGFGADRSYFLADYWDGVLQYQATNSAPIPVAAGGLWPRRNCSDVTFDAQSGIASYGLCDKTTYPGLPYDIPRAGALQAKIGGTVFYLQNVGLKLLLMRRGDGAGAVSHADLTSAFDTTADPIYKAIPMRLVATPDGAKLFVLAYQTIAGNGFSSRIIEVDASSGRVDSVAMPPLLATDIAMSPRGDLYLTTRFGEILRRPSGTADWSRFGHLSQAHGDLRVAIDPYERVFAYGAYGVMMQQGTAARVEEFYHSGLGHYFMTGDAAEAKSLRDDPALGWAPTGESFNAIANFAWDSATSAPRAVCRFYGSVSPGPNSHFYTAVPSECAGLKSLQQSAPATQPRWNYEGISFWAMGGFASGNCRATETMVRRFFNGGASRGLTPNHRYVQGTALPAELVKSGWIAEESAFCVPSEWYTRTFQ